MLKPIAPLVCSPDIAALIGAKLYVEPSTGLAPGSAAATIVQAASRIGARGDIPVLTHGKGSVWSWPVQLGARHTGAGF